MSNPQTPSNFFPASGASFPDARAFSSGDVASPRAFDQDDQQSTPADFRGAVNRIGASDETERAIRARGPSFVDKAKHLGAKALQKGLPLGVSVVAAVGAGNMIQGNNDAESNPYAGMHTVPVTVTGSMGANEAIYQVDPKIADEAWKSEENAQALEDLQDHIEDQSITNNGVLQPGQTVEVPFIDGQQYNSGQ